MIECPSYSVPSPQNETRPRPHDRDGAISTHENESCPRQHDMPHLAERTDLYPKNDQKICLSALFAIRRQQSRPRFLSATCGISGEGRCCGKPCRHGAGADRYSEGFPNPARRRESGPAAQASRTAGPARQTGGTRKGIPPVLLSIDYEKASVAYFFSPLT